MATLFTFHSIKKTLNSKAELQLFFYLCVAAWRFGRSVKGCTEFRKYITLLCKNKPILEGFELYIKVYKLNRVFISTINNNVLFKSVVLFRAVRVVCLVKALHYELRVVKVCATQCYSQIHHAPTERLSNRAILACTRRVKIISFENEV